MYLEEDDETRYRAESYNLGQFRLSMSWNKLILKYRNRTIDELLVVFMDSATFMTVTPSLGSISPMSNSDMLTFQYYLADSLDFAVEKLILNMKISSITPNYNQQSKLLKRIVIFKNYNQLKQIKSVLQKQDEYIKGKCAPTKEQLELCRGALSMDFGKDTPEMNQGHIEVMCEEANVSQFINNYSKFQE